MTVKRVRTIAKVEDQRRDDRSIITKVKPVWYLPKVMIEPKSNIAVRFQAAAWSENSPTIQVRSAQVSNQIWFTMLFPDYVLKSYQISRITFYSARTVTTLSTGTSGNIFTDFMFQPFGSWTESSNVQYVGGRELRESQVVSAQGCRGRITYYPSKRDRQFVFDARTGNQGNYTANDLCALVTEANTPAESRHDCYIDFEVTRWGFGQTVTAWTLGCGRPQPKPDYKGPFESSIRPWGADIDLPRNKTRYDPDTVIEELDSDDEESGLRKMLYVTCVIRYTVASDASMSMFYPHTISCVHRIWYYLYVYKLYL